MFLKLITGFDAVVMLIAVYGVYLNPQKLNITMLSALCAMVGFHIIVSNKVHEIGKSRHQAILKQKAPPKNSLDVILSRTLLPERAAQEMEIMFGGDGWKNKKIPSKDNVLYYLVIQRRNRLRGSISYGVATAYYKNGHWISTKQKGLKKYIRKSWILGIKEKDAPLNDSSD